VMRVKGKRMFNLTLGLCQFSCRGLSIRRQRRREAQPRVARQLRATLGWRALIKRTTRNGLRNGGVDFSFATFSRLEANPISNPG